MGENGSLEVYQLQEQKVLEQYTTYVHGIASNDSKEVLHLKWGESTLKKAIVIIQYGKRNMRGLLSRKWQEKRKQRLIPNKQHTEGCCYRMPGTTTT